MRNKSILDKPVGGTSADIADAIAKKHTQGTDQGLDTGGINAVTAAQAKAVVSGFNAITYSRFEKSLAESLMPADGFTYFHLGGLFEEDADSNLMPKASPDASIDTFFTLDISDNIQPSA